MQYNAYPLQYMGIYNYIPIAWLEGYTPSKGLDYKENRGHSFFHIQKPFDVWSDRPGFIVSNEQGESGYCDGTSIQQLSPGHFYGISVQVGTHAELFYYRKVYNWPNYYIAATYWIVDFTNLDVLYEDSRYPQPTSSAILEEYQINGVYNADTIWKPEFEVFTGREAVDFIMKYHNVHSVNPNWVNSTWVYGYPYRQGRYIFKAGTPPKPTPPTPRYDYGELELWEGLPTRETLIHERMWCNAHSNMAASLPRSAANQIGNIIAVFDALKSAYEIVKMKRLPDLDNIRDLISGLHLKKRYVVQTTLSDYDDVLEVYTRLADLYQLTSETLTLHGTYTRNNITYRVSADVCLSQIIPSDIRDQLQAFGLRGGLYNAWDLVPYSFIVDWFIPIGSWLEQNEEYAYSLNLDYLNYYRSIEIRYDDGQVSYIRLAGSPQLSLGPSLSTHSASNQTWLQRCADVLSIFIL